MARTKNKHTQNTFSKKIEEIISSDSMNKKTELFKLANELAEKEKEDLKMYYGRRNFFIFTIIIVVFSVAGNFLLLDRNDALNNKIETLEYRDSLFYQFMEPDSASIITYRIKNGKTVTYHQLEKEKDSLQAQYHDMESLKEHYRIEVGLATKNYPITFSKEGNVYSIHATQLDSALLLLPVYRDMIKYNDNTQTWTVTRIDYNRK